MNLIGMGLLCSQGRGVDTFRRALVDGRQSPSTATFRGRPFPVHQVDLDRVQDGTALKKLRRADKLSKMAVLAATDAVRDSGLADEQTKKLGVIVATAFGAHVTTFDFLDGILDYGEAAVSPTVFSNSVHNAAASYLSSALGIQGPTLTVTRFFFPLQSALQLADAWLRESRVEQVLVGAVDQLGEVLAYIMETRLGSAPDGIIRPFAGNPGTVPGEGAAFFVLTRGHADRAYCRVPGVRFEAEGGIPEKADLDVLDLDGLSGGLSRHGSPSNTPVAAYAPLYGSMMIGSAFSLAAAALMIRHQAVYPNPVPEVPETGGGVSQPAVSSIDFIRCIRYNCEGEKSIIDVRKA